MSRYIQLFLLTLLFAGLTLGLVGCGSDRTDKVAFLTMATDHNSDQISVMKKDGTQVKPAGDPGQYNSVTLSPDGKKLAVSYYDGDDEIGVMDASMRRS